ncbi:hypothetical protein [Sphingomonas mucosissima]|uniref:Uncharacterized protein n=1 Tax=Sphingomonas mucosissima TaxID=370959 RepID=A0A245ZMJ3_9SPHN|nr:hypothetical protein [Sphingomonas mucosissima]OWK30966.1 hypothetical protein SPMU_19580 [Sphingomonas mucosissima]
MSQQDPYAHERATPQVPQCGRSTVSIVAAVAAVWISAGVLIEAYGAGPPYYGRTTNMDKWTSPWPVVAVAVVSALVVAAIALRPILSKSGAKQNKAN